MLVFKNFIKKVFNNYPLLRFIILYFFRKLKLSARALNSDFPISNKNSLELNLILQAKRTMVVISQTFFYSLDNLKMI